jgi:hypothetical protein
MEYNQLDSKTYTGIVHYINDLNIRFSNLLFTDIVGYTANYLGLAQLAITKIPQAKDANGEYQDVLFDDNYSLVLSYIESGARKVIDGAFESKIDLLVSVNMKKFTAYEEEGIIQAIYDVMKVTSFEPLTELRDLAALKGVVYDSLIPDSMYPYFVFRIQSKILINLN